jgi:hypothetical protein
MNSMSLQENVSYKNHLILMEHPTKSVSCCLIRAERYRMDIETSIWKREENMAQGAESIFAEHWN